MVENAERVPLELFVEALQLAGGDPGTAATLVDALHRRARAAAEAGDEAGRLRALRLQRVFASLQLSSRLIELERWKLALGSPSAESLPPPLSEDELDPLSERVSELEDALAAAPDDVELRILLGETLLRFGRLQLLLGRDPSLLLEDARSAAGRAMPDARAHGLYAVASFLLNDMQGAADNAAIALPGLVGRAGSGLAAEVLDAFAQARTRALYDAMNAEPAGVDWPGTWIADIRAAYAALLGHPAATETQALAYVQVLDVLEARGLEEEAIEAALKRFPESSALHGWRRSAILRDHGADMLELAYSQRPTDPEQAAVYDWYAGLATLVAAEWRIQNREREAALGSYERALARLRASAKARPEFESSASYYACMALAGRARLFVEKGELDGALASARMALDASSTARVQPDGLGHTPEDTARLVQAALREAGRGQEAEALGVGDR